jgi:hypothetical protein
VAGAVAELVVAERGEEGAIAGEPGQLHGSDRAAASGFLPRFAGVDDVAGGGHARDADELDPLDMSDDGDAHARSMPCGDSGGGETTQTDPGTSAAPTTDDGTTGQTPTEGTADATDGTTDGTTTDSGTSEPTTGAVSDPEILQKCDDGFANDAKLAEAQCQCQVALGIYADLAECLADVKMADAELRACTCEVYSRHPDVEAALDCVGPAQTDALACTMGVMCTEDTPEPLFECLEPFYTKIVRRARRRRSRRSPRWRSRAT